MKKRLIIMGIILLVLIIVGGLIFISMNKENKQTNSPNQENNPNQQSYTFIEKITDELKNNLTNP